MGYQEETIISNGYGQQTIVEQQGGYGYNQETIIQENGFGGPMMGGPMMGAPMMGAPMVGGPMMMGDPFVQQDMMQVQMDQQNVQFDETVAAADMMMGNDVGAMMAMQDANMNM